MLKNTLKLQGNQKLNRNELKKVTGGAGNPSRNCPENCFIDANLPNGDSCDAPLKCLPSMCHGGWDGNTCQ
ncbi:hypothetical protein DBR43_08155 [Pedobacter sp. KBW06]|uniref:hypothetical protein n=1 Tax=Pedobacter sp. KBW06 TaxID=2153359 RepID=UPI000F5A90D8|nr:hypothetical protein [Pedobacter sp. KBW06]RQO75320.1 hypothetical protein DBR43_08155 [Pedobacter sp. KBW06]